VLCSNTTDTTGTTGIQASLSALPHPSPLVARGCSISPLPHSYVGSPRFLTVVALDSALTLPSAIAAPAARSAHWRFCVNALGVRFHSLSRARFLNADKLTGRLGEAVSDYRVGFLSLSQPNLKDLISAPLEGVRPSQVDYVMTFDGWRYGFRVIANPAKHIQRGDIASIIALAKPLAHLPGKKLGSLPAPTAGPTAASQFEDA
jgi:hypothetical protein